MMNTKEVLIVARKLLIEVGWCKGWAVKFKADKPIAFCATGAIQYVSAPWRLKDKADDALRTAINWDYIPQWNDHKKRTKRQVLAAFNKAIKSLNNKK